MINQFALNKAFLEKLKSITNLPIAVSGSQFTPKVDQDYIAEKEVPTSVEGKVGNGSDVQRGFYQVTICTELRRRRLHNLEIVDSIMSHFTRGTSAGIEFNGQKVSISTIQPSGIYNDETHLKTALTIRYTVIA